MIRENIAEFSFLLSNDFSDTRKIRSSSERESGISRVPMRSSGPCKSTRSSGTMCRRSETS